jgi:hypothetical protein
MDKYLFHIKSRSDSDAPAFNCPLYQIQMPLVKMPHHGSVDSDPHKIIVDQPFFKVGCTLGEGFRHIPAQSSVKSYLNYY